jgi:hypothetical protein
MSIIALGKEPRGFAIAGVAIGALGSCGIIITLLFLPLIAFALAAAGFAAFAVTLMGEDFGASWDMAIIAGEIGQYQDANAGALPADLDALGFEDPQYLTDPWGNAYVYEPAPDGSGFTLFSMGEDGLPGTPDDVQAKDGWEINLK